MIRSIFFNPFIVVGIFEWAIFISVETQQTVIHDVIMLQVFVPCAWSGLSTADTSTKIRMTGTYQIEENLYVNGVRKKGHQKQQQRNNSRIPLKQFHLFDKLMKHIFHQTHSRQHAHCEENNEINIIGFYMVYTCAFSTTTTATYKISLIFP